MDTNVSAFMGCNCFCASLIASIVLMAYQYINKKPLRLDFGIRSWCFRSSILWYDLQVSNTRERAASKERASQSKVIELETQLSRTNSELNQLRRAKDEVSFIMWRKELTVCDSASLQTLVTEINCPSSVLFIAFSHFFRVHCYWIFRRRRGTRAVCRTWRTGLNSRTAPIAVCRIMFNSSKHPMLACSGTRL